jgi:hypothetical protein
MAGYYSGKAMVRRREVLRETLEAFADPNDHERYRQLAFRNLEKWRLERILPERKEQVIGGDWGEVTLILTRKHGECFAVLNMANAYIPGGGYVEGMSAQEENMYRRTDCHFYINDREYDRKRDTYLPEMTQIISGKPGRVYLDHEHPRICIRGREDHTDERLGYAWLPSDEIFPFYELRAAAQDLRSGEAFDATEARKRIAAQLDTLLEHGVRYAVLGAFGCGAFMNPPEIVAQIYREEIGKRIKDLDLVAFAIYDTGSGRGNLLPFRERLG